MPQDQKKDHVQIDDVPNEDEKTEYERDAAETDLQELMYMQDKEEMLKFAQLSEYE